MRGTNARVQTTGWLPDSYGVEWRSRGCSWCAPAWKRRFNRGKVSVGHPKRCRRCRSWCRLGVRREPDSRMVTPVASAPMTTTNETGWVEPSLDETDMLLWFLQYERDK